MGGIVVAMKRFEGRWGGTLHTETFGDGGGGGETLPRERFDLHKRGATTESADAYQPVLVALRGGIVEAETVRYSCSSSGQNLNLDWQKRAATIASSPARAIAASSGHISPLLSTEIVPGIRSVAIRISRLELVGVAFGASGIAASLRELTDCIER